MKDRKGFVIIETLIVTVMLTTCLVLIYSTYSSAINTERSRMFYDDISYVYKANNIKRWLEGYYTSELIIENKNNLFVMPGVSSNPIIEEYRISDMLLLNPYCTKSSTCSDATAALKYTNDDGTEKNVLLENEFKSYLKTIGSNEDFIYDQIISYNYILVVRFSQNINGEPCDDESGNNCVFHYAYSSTNIGIVDYIKPPL